MFLTRYVSETGKRASASILVGSVRLAWRQSTKSSDPSGGITFYIMWEIVVCFLHESYDSIFSLALSFSLFKSRLLVWDAS